MLRPSFHCIKGTRHGHRPDHWCQPGSPQGAWQVSPSPLEGRPLHGGGEQLHSLTGTLLSSPDSLLTSAGTRGYLHCIRVIIQHLILFFAHSSSFGCWELSYTAIPNSRSKTRERVGRDDLFQFLQNCE